MYSKIPIIHFATYQGKQNWSLNSGPSLQNNETMHAPECFGRLYVISVGLSQRYDNKTEKVTKISVIGVQC